MNILQVLILIKCITALGDTWASFNGANEAILDSATKLSLAEHRNGNAKDEYLNDQVVVQIC